MKKLIYLIAVLFIANSISAQVWPAPPWNPITGKNNYKDSIANAKLKNNIAEDSVISTDIYGRFKLKKVTGGGSTFDSTYIYILANSKVPLIRTLTINGVTQDMTANMDFTVSPPPADTSNKWVQGVYLNLTMDSLIVVKGGIRTAYPLSPGTIIINPSSGIDSLTYINNTLIQWASGVSTSFRLNKFYDSTHLNFDSTRYIHYNGGTIVDSVIIPTDYVVAGIGMNITDSLAGGKNYKVFNSTGSGGITIPQLTDSLNVRGDTYYTSFSVAGDSSYVTFNRPDGTKDTLRIAGGTGTVTNVAALTLGTTGTDLSSTVATSTTTPVITLNVPTASASNRGALSAADWTTFNSKQAALSGTGYSKWSGSTPSYLTPTQVTADLNLFTSSLQGLTPLSGGGTSNFLRADGTWAIPPSGGGGSVSDFTAGDLSPLFTSSVATSTTTPALTFNAGNTTQFTVLGRIASGSGAYSFLTADSSLIADLHSQTYYDLRYASISAYGQWLKSPTFPNNIFRSVGRVGIGDTAKATLSVTNSRVPYAFGVFPAATDTLGILIANDTPATASVMSFSPSLVFRGQGWKTNATAGSQPVGVRLYAYTASGAANPTGGFAIETSVNNSAYSTQQFNFTSAGNLSMGGSVTANGGFSSNGSFSGAGFGVTGLTSTINGNALVTTPTTALGLLNNTASTSGVPVQYSPSLRISGTAWNTSASVTSDFRFGNRPVSAATPTGSIVWQYANSNTSYTDIHELKSNGRVVMSNTITTKGYTVATLPAGNVGDIAYVTDALTPTYLAVLVGGGAVVTPVFYNGTAWVSY